MTLEVGNATRRMIRPQRTYNRRTAAIGVIETDGAVSYTAAAKSILERFGNIALLRPYLLGSATGALMLAGDVAEVRGATDRDWLMQEEVLGRFYKRGPLVGTRCFENPSEALWAVTRDLEPMEAPPLDLISSRLTLAVFETLREVPFLEALEFIGQRIDLAYIGAMNFGSKHKSVFFAGEQALAEDAKFGAKDLIRKLMAEKAIDGEYDGSWFLPLDSAHHDLQFLLPWRSNPRPYHDNLGRDSYLAIETQGLVAMLDAVNRAAWHASVQVIASRELGSGTETAILTATSLPSNEEHINQAAERLVPAAEWGKSLAGKSSVLNLRRWHHPNAIFGAHMTALPPTQPLFDLTGLSLGLVDVRDRGGLYDAVHELRRHDVRFIGTRKIGSRQAFMAFAGPQPAVEAALGDIKERAEQERTKPGRCGELYDLRIIVQPNDQVQRLLPWQKPFPYAEEAPKGTRLSDPYYQPGQPFALVETLGMTHGLVIANRLLHEGVTPVSIYSVGSGLKVFHFTAKDYELLRGLTDWKFLVKDVCADLPHTAEAKDGLDRMLVNVAAYAEPGPIWQMVEHQSPVPAELMARLTEGNNALGLMTVRGVIPTHYLLDQLKGYEVKLWGIQKSGGLHMTVVIYGPLSHVDSAIREISERMQALQAEEAVLHLAHVKPDDKARDYKMQELYGWTRTWAVIGNPDPKLAFFLPRQERVGV